jgi:glycosyltransferase involved in cell wall biosynthesis
MNSNPLVSVVVPTRNSSRFIDACLRSIQAQTYTPIEIVVVDNNSTDDTKKIAERYASKVLNRGPERSAQVNYGVENARGEYVYKVDSDFVLEPTVVSECVTRAKEGFDAVVVHNSPDVRIGWIARIRKFEVDMYKYDITHSSARFVRREVFREIDGFDSAITAGEDYDFQNKLNRAGYRTGFIEAEALHLGEPTHLWPHLRKYYDYGRDFIHYQGANKAESTTQLAVFRSVYARNWRRFVRHPLMGIAFVIYNSAKYAAGGSGFVVGKLRQRTSGSSSRN